MGLSEIEVGQLAIMQRSPTRYIERRVEQLDLSDDYHFGASVTQQVRLPTHGPNRGEQDVLVPLGQFTKGRMPNLRIAGPDGTVLPLLTERERKQLGATLFTTRWHDRLFGDLDEAVVDQAQQLWQEDAYLMVGEIAVRPMEAALDAIDELEWHLDDLSAETESEGLRRFLQTVLREDELWRDLESLAQTQLLVARMRAEPERPYVVTIEYTERFHYRDYAATTPHGVLSKGLAWLGLIGTPIARSAANVGQAATLWVVQMVPDGVEALRYYWRSEAKQIEPEEPSYVEGTRAVVSRHREGGEQVENNRLMLDVQISPSAAITATIALAALLLVISTYVFQALPEVRSEAGAGYEERGILVGLGSIFAAIPAAIAGALAYREQTFVRHISRGPRVLLAVLSGWAAFFAAVVSLKDLGDLSEAVAYSLSLYSLIVIGIFSFIQLGPRWRKNDRSRRKNKTRRTSPFACQRKQIWQAILCLGFWALVVVFAARTQAVLQHDHFFSPDFPGNVWSAWWSWFGLTPYEHLGALECSPSIC